jgi:hypothetical protein
MLNTHIYHQLHPTTRQYKRLKACNPTKYNVWRDLVPPYSNCIVQLLVQGTTWWWPSYKAETCSCIIHSDTIWRIVCSVLTAHICKYIHILLHPTYFGVFYTIFRGDIALLAEKNYVFFAILFDMLCYKLYNMSCFLKLQLSYNF